LSPIPEVEAAAELGRGPHAETPPGYRLGMAIAGGTLLVLLLRYFAAG
jgi:hypothetical protein